MAHFCKSWFFRFTIQISTLIHYALKNRTKVIILGCHTTHKIQEPLISVQEEFVQNQLRSKCFQVQTVICWYLPVFLYWLKVIFYVFLYINQQICLKSSTWTSHFSNSTSSSVITGWISPFMAPHIKIKQQLIVTDLAVDAALQKITDNGGMKTI